MADDIPITQEEMIELLGDRMPIEAASLFFESGGGATAGEIRARLRQIAAERHSAMSREALIILDLSRRHMYAAREGDEERRVRLFCLLDEFEWAYPEAAAEVGAMYPAASR